MTVSTGNAFESAALSFSAPLVLPAPAAKPELVSKSEAEPESVASTPPAATKKVRFAAEVPAALPSDLYTLCAPAEIEKITADIDAGLFVGSDSWLPGKKHHPNHYDVRKVLMIVKKHPLGASSYTINTGLSSMCRARVATILRQLKIQGIIQVKTKV
jgi:hypothetical protein